MKGREEVMQKGYWDKFLFKNYIKYFLKYLTGFMFILAPCLVIVMVSWKTTQEQVVTAGELRFQEGMTEISSEISKMNILQNDIKNSTSFQALVQIKGEIPWGQYMELHHVNEQLKEMRYLYEFSPYYFVMFSDNDLFVSTQQCDESFSERYYGNMMKASKDGQVLNAEEFRQLILQTSTTRYSFVKLDSFSYYTDEYCNVEDPILCVVNDSYLLNKDKGYRMVCVLPAETVIGLLLTEECRSDGIVHITDVAGNTLLRYGNRDGIMQNTDHVVNTEKHWLISAKDIGETGWTVQIGIPKTVISQQMDVLYKLIYAYVLLGLVLVFGLSCYYGRKQYRALKNFYALVPGEETMEKPEASFRKDEYEPLFQAFGRMADDSRRYQQQKQELEQQKYAIRLEKLITGGINSQEEREELKKSNMIAAEFFCVAIARMRAAAESEYGIAILSLKDYLQENWKDKVFHIHTGIDDELFVFSLISDQEPNVRAVQKLFEEAVLLLSEKLSVDLSVGISTVGTDVSNLKRCYTQAQYVLDAYYHESKNTVSCYLMELDHCKDAIVNMDSLNQIYHSLVYLNKEGVQKSLWLIRAYCSRNPVAFEMQKEQIFYSVRNTLYNAMLYISEKPEATGILPVYDKADHVDVMLEKLREAAEGLIELGLSRKQAEKEESRDEIIAYLESRYSDKNLSVNQICGDLEISERFLQTAIKDKTGDTFAVYLEKLRIRKATELLLNTKLSNEQIADEVGFVAVSTFYRVFNKRMGMSPKAFREV